MKLKDICVLDVVCCNRQETILAAAHTMRERHVGDLIVVNDLHQDRSPVGILTDRDIVIEVLGKGLDPAKTKVGDVMTSHLVIAVEGETVEDGLKRMLEHGVRRLPIVDDEEEVVGVVTLDDLYRLNAEQARALCEVVTKERTREGRTKR